MEIPLSCEDGLPQSLAPIEPPEAAPPATLTPAAAVLIRNVIDTEKLDLKRTVVVVAQDEAGFNSLDLQEWDDVASPRAAGFVVGQSQGLTVAAALEDAQRLGADRVIESMHGSLVVLGGPSAATVASDPGGIPLNREALQRLEPDAGGHALERYAWHLANGDSRAALVVAREAERVIVAAYTDELDTVALLAFGARLPQVRERRPGDRLLAVNTYVPRSRGLAPDLAAGSNDTGRYGNFHPLIADFLTDDLALVEARKREINEGEWRQCEVAGAEAMARLNGRFRDGRPSASGEPAIAP